MARSSYIYLVVDTWWNAITYIPDKPNPWEFSTDNEYVVAAFTVKHEMVTYLEKYHDKRSLKIYRYRDGEPDKVTKMDLKELLGEDYE